MKLAHADRLGRLHVVSRTRSEKRLNQVILDVLRSPFQGIGKPEPLKGELAGYWSRRIDDEHRLVYAISSTEVLIVGCR